MKTTNCLLILLAIFIHGSVFAQQVGEVKYARGVVTVQQPDGTDGRLIGKGDKLAQGEVIKTGNKSFAIVKLSDDSKLTLRPGSSFAVEQMDAKQEDTATALLRLFRGGFRAITGYISKRNPKGYRVKTSVATIGIRGTEFDARLCTDDCNAENAKHHKKVEKSKIKSVGRVVFKQGELKATNFAEKKRELKAGSNLYEGDLLDSGDNAYAVLAFRDNSRINLQANTRFRIDELRYEEKKPDKASSLFSLLRGGLRTVTGLIGKINPSRYKMRTRVVTIGIRGTGYDLLCSGACADNNLQTPDLPEGNGLYANVWEGSVLMGEQPINQGQAGFMRDQSTPPVVLPQVPQFFQQNPVPKPDQSKPVKFDDTAKQEEAPPGLYVSVTEGTVTVKGDKSDKVVAITKGQAAYADTTGRQVKQLPSIPVFQQFDSTPKPEGFSPKALNVEGTAIGDDNDLLCEIQ